jgi:hypothetical protein
MKQYDFSHEFFEKQNKQTLKNWGKSIFEILSWIKHYFLMFPTLSILNRLNHNGLVEFCHFATHYLLETNFYKYKGENYPDI